MKKICLTIATLLLAAAPAVGVVSYGRTLASLDDRTSSYTGTAVQLTERVRNVIGRLTITNNSGTTPTADCKIQHAPSDTSALYKDLIVFSQATTGGPTYEDVHVTAFDTVLHPFVRAVCTLAGTSPNYDITINLYSDLEP